MPEALTRAALIDAAAASLGGCGCAEADGSPCSNCRIDAGQMLDAVLPLIADAIEQLDRAWHFRGPGDPGIEIVSRAAVLDLVRSLLEADDEH